MTQSSKKNYIKIDDVKPTPYAKNVKDGIDVNITKKTIMNILDRTPIKYSKKELKPKLIARLLSYVNKSGNPTDRELKNIEEIRDRITERKNEEPPSVQVEPPKKSTGSAPPKVRQTEIGAKPRRPSSDSFSISTRSSNPSTRSPGIFSRPVVRRGESFGTDVPNLIKRGSRQSTSDSFSISTSSSIPTTGSRQSTPGIFSRPVVRSGETFEGAPSLVPLYPLLRKKQNTADSILSSNFAGSDYSGNSLSGYVPSI